MNASKGNINYSSCNQIIIKYKILNFYILKDKWLISLLQHPKKNIKPSKPLPFKLLNTKVNKEDNISKYMISSIKPITNCPFIVYSQQVKSMANLLSLNPSTFNAKYNQYQKRTPYQTKIKS